MNWLIKLGVLLLLAATWMTHFVACIKANTIALLCLGTIIPPIGWLHGVVIWLGLV